MVEGTFEENPRKSCHPQPPAPPGSSDVQRHWESKKIISDTCVDFAHLRELSSGKTSVSKDLTGGREGGVSCLEGTLPLSMSAFSRFSVFRALGWVGRAGGWSWRGGSGRTASRSTLRKLEEETYLAAASFSSAGVEGRPRIRFWVSTGKRPKGILRNRERQVLLPQGNLPRIFPTECSPPKTISQRQNHLCPVTSPFLSGWVNATANWDPRGIFSSTFFLFSAFTSFSGFWSTSTRFSAGSGLVDNDQSINLHFLTSIPAQICGKG